MFATLKTTLTTVKPRAVDDVLRDIAREEPDELLWCPGLIAGKSREGADCARVGIFEVSGGRSTLADVWVVKDQQDALTGGLASIAHTERGHGDAYFRTAWRLIWRHGTQAAHGPGSLAAGRADWSCWSRWGRIINANQGYLTHNRWGIHDPNAGTTIRREEITGIRMFLTDDWGRYGVAVERAGSAPFTLITRRNLIARLDPTYDGLSLGMDVMWAESLARDLAAAMDLPYSSDADR